MLKLIDVLKPAREIITFDPYIPINIQFGLSQGARAPYLYLMSHKFIEFGIDSMTQGLGSITVIYATSVLWYAKIIDVSVQEEIGLPVFSTILWKEGESSRDEDRDKALEVFVGDASFTICLASDYKIESLVRNGRVLFGFDKDKFLCCIQIQEITPVNMNILRESLSE